MFKNLAVFLMTALAADAQWNLMPMPSSIQAGNGRTKLEPFSVKGGDSRLQAALRRFGGSQSLENSASTNSNFRIEIASPGQPVQQFGEDESYRLEVAAGHVMLTAPTTLGALHGLETLRQLRAADGTVPNVLIDDHPRFPWRGLHMDVARHFMPVDAVKRNLDGMAAVKLNVFHWHLSDDQGFRVESKLYPKLQEKGSDGLYYTQEQIRDVVRFAGERGIRVVPEFDIPGHATSWLVGYPELSAGPGPFQIIRTWGIFDPTLDPSNPKVYEFLDGFIGEMAGLFPDAYFHIGGDEVTGKQWAEKGLGKMSVVHAGFNQKVQKIIAKHGKRMEGWDEILNDALPRDIVIQSWRGQKSLFDAAREGFSGILSAGYYLDHMDSAAKHYGVDPLDEKGRATGMLRNPDAKAAPAVPLTEAQRKRILGGEVCMWTEYVSPETLDSRVWPRTAAIAERFWSPVEVNNVADMYRRLDWVSTYLDTRGLKHNTNYTAMLERLAGTKAIEPLKTLADVVDPGDLGLRHRMKKDYTQQTPLDRFVDAARPDSPVAHGFNLLVDRYSADQNDAAARREIVRWLQLWAANDGQLRPLLDTRKSLNEIGPLSRNLSLLAAGILNPETSKATLNELVRNAKQPVAEVRLSIAGSLERLIGLASVNTR